MIIPNSFICFHSLKNLYEIGISKGTPFLCENINTTMNMNEKKRMLFVPDIYFMGVEKKENSTIQEILHFIKKGCDKPHFSSEDEFRGELQNHCLLVKSKRLRLVGGEIIGVKTAKKQRILLDDLMEEKEIELHSKCCGIYIPSDKILNRTKFQWFALLSSQQIFESKSFLSKYLPTTSIVPNLNTEITNKLYVDNVKESILLESSFMVEW